MRLTLSNLWAFTLIQASRCTIKLKQRCLVQLQEKMRKASLVTCRRSSCPNNTPLVKEDMKGEPKGEHDLTDGVRSSPMQLSLFILL